MGPRPRPVVRKITQDNRDTTVTVSGGTSGSWQETAVGAKQASVVTAKCATGMTCVIDVNVYPKGKQPSQLGRCHLTQARA